ncbi:MAG: hydrogenase expression/formation protein HypE [Patescibacteria group bacterium]|nr:hydrogenase expression/formation protein HypE [Patescibacteria group bacterium]
MSNEPPREFTLSCPLPMRDHATVQMAHGGGGRLMQELIEGLFLPGFAPGGKPAVPHDSALLDVGPERLAFTTDSFVVHPLFFPGGDIGTLAVCGTVNDLAMAGAKPLCLSAGFILEEGLPLDTLRRVVESMRRTADEAGVRIVTGDTKVVDRGRGDGIYINTAGIGLVGPRTDIHPRRVVPGDAILVSGDLGRHGVAVMSVREGLEFAGAPESDCAPLNGLVEDMLAAGAELHCLRDLTRGGLAAALNEIARHAGVGIELDEAAVPVCDGVRGACELLGLDPLYVANEGRLVAFCPAEAAEEMLHLMHAHRRAENPAIVGQVTGCHPGIVELRSPFGGGRILDLLSGEQMPRIC